MNSARCRTKKGRVRPAAVHAREDSISGIVPSCVLSHRFGAKQRKGARRWLSHGRIEEKRREQRCRDSGSRQIPRVIRLYAHSVVRLRSFLCIQIPNEHDFTHPDSPLVSQSLAGASLEPLDAVGWPSQSTP